MANSNHDADEDTAMMTIQPEQGPSHLGERVSTVLCTLIFLPLTPFQKRRLSESAHQNNKRLTKRANMALGSMPASHQVIPNPICTLDPRITTRILGNK
jgi:hypothetical protein